MKVNAMIKVNFRQSDEDIVRQAEAMKLIDMTNDSEFIRDAIRRRCKQIERAAKRGKGG